MHVFLTPRELLGIAYNRNREAPRLFPWLRPSLWSQEWGKVLSNEASIRRQAGFTHVSFMNCAYVAFDSDLCHLIWKRYHFQHLQIYVKNKCVWGSHLGESVMCCLCLLMSRLTGGVCMFVHVSSMCISTLWEQLLSHPDEQSEVSAPFSNKIAESKTKCRWMRNSIS